ncbi:hypothetical protein R1sor_005878 [Riccia sorocarpa]|uniref:BED-type domain-containing protein n=1 Tax=Riccia sorocarpa TaxID=122646 RepID=A0ABD3HNS6_9MARC
MKTENVEAGPSAPDAGIPQPRDEAGKFTIRHYVVLQDQKPGNPRIICRYCTFEITHNITRMKHHLTGLNAAPPKASTALNKRGEKNQQTCQFVPVVVRKELTRLMSVQERKSCVEDEHYKACKVEPDEGDLCSSQAASPSPGFSSNPDLAQGSMEYNRALRDRSASRTPTSSLLGGSESACGLSSLEPERRMPSKNDIWYYHNMKQQHEADKKWVRAVYELGLPFNIFTHKVFKEAYEFSRHLPRYVLPGPKKLSNDLLEDEFKEVKDRTEKLMFPPVPQGFSKVTLTCDGWTNIQGRPIVNFLIVNKYGEMYHNSVDCSGIYKDATWESGELIKVIEELGPENVLEFVADNAAVNRKADELIQEKYPHIVFGGCVAHGLNLLSHDLGQYSWITSLFDKCQKMVAFIKNHHMTNAIFIDKFSDGLTLLRSGATRFMTNFIMIDRAYALRYCLKEMTSCKEWEKYEGGITDWTAKGKCMDTRLTIEDKNFWDEIHDLLWLIHPIWVLLRKMDSHRHFIGHIYWESWNLEDILKKMHTNVKLKSQLLTHERCELISVNAHARWEMWNNELHPTAMLLMPFYFTKPSALPYLQIEHVKQSFRRYVRIYGTHVLKKQLDEIEEYVEKCMDDLTLVLGGDHRIINHENSVKLAEKYKDEPHRWYIVYGDGIPAMRDLAMQILGQSVTSSACERNWSSFSHIQNKKRNRLTVERKFEDDIDDDDLCNEEGDAESEDDYLIDVLLREQVRFDNGSASVRPGHNERLVTVEDIAYDETISISMPKVEVEQAVSKPEYGRLIGKMWEKFAAPAPTKQHVAKRAKVSASNPNVPLVTCSNLKPKDLPASSSGQAILNYPPSHGGRYRPDSPQVSSQAGASSPTLSGNGEKRQSSRNKPPVSYKAFLG